MHSIKSTRSVHVPYHDEEQAEHSNSTHQASHSQHVEEAHSHQDHHPTHAENTAEILETDKHAESAPPSAAYPRVVVAQMTRKRRNQRSNTSEEEGSTSDEKADEDEKEQELANRQANVDGSRASSSLSPDEKRLIREKVSLDRWEYPSGIQGLANLQIPPQQLPKAKLPREKPSTAKKTKSVKLAAPQLKTEIVHFKEELSLRRRILDEYEKQLESYEQALLRPASISFQELKLIEERAKHATTPQEHKAVREARTTVNDYTKQQILAIHIPETQKQITKAKQGIAFLENLILEKENELEGRGSQKRRSSRAQQADNPPQSGLFRRISSWFRDRPRYPNPSPSAAPTKRPWYRRLFNWFTDLFR